jgi:hypothetical protein
MLSSNHTAVSLGPRLPIETLHAGRFMPSDGQPLWDDRGDSPFRQSRPDCGLTGLLGQAEGEGPFRANPRRGPVCLVRACGSP